MRDRPKILVVGSFMMDLIASAERAPASGETVVGMGFATAPGGKGANQAVQCARLGACVTMVGRVGDDLFGRTMLDAVRGAGVDVSHVAIDSREPSGVGHILLEVCGEGTKNRITVCPGANLRVTVEDLEWLREEIGGYDFVLLQFELPMPVVEAVAGWAHEKGIPVMVNPAPAAPVSQRLLSCADYLSPNEHEAAILSKHPIRIEKEGARQEDIQAVSAALRQAGAQNLIITMGDQGAAWAGPDGIIRIPCAKAPRVADPTAAGDSFVAAFCTGLCAGLTHPEALTFASHTAALTVSRMGAMPSLPDIKEVRTFMGEQGCRVTVLRKLERLEEGWDES